MRNKKLVIEDMPPYAKKEGIRLSKLILLPISVDLNNVLINFWSSSVEEQEQDPDLSYVEAALRGAKAAKSIKRKLNR